MVRSQCLKPRQPSVNAALALLQVLNKNLLPQPQPLLSSLHNSHSSQLGRSLPVPRLFKWHQSQMLSLSLISELPHPSSSRRHRKPTLRQPTIGVLTGVTLVTRPPSRLSPPKMSISNLFNNRCNSNLSSSNLLSNNLSQQRTCLTASSTCQQRRSSKQPSLQVVSCLTDSNLIKWAACNRRANLRTTPSTTSSVLTLPVVPSRTTTKVTRAATATQVWLTKVWATKV